MDQMQIRIIILLIIVALVSVSGIILRRKGRPYKTGILTIHKLAAIGGIILTWIISLMIISDPDVYGMDSATRILIIVLTLLSVISGAIQSLDKPVSKLIILSHRLSSYFLIILVAYKLTSYF